MRNGKEKEEKKEDWKDYTCDICDKKIATKKGLSIHKSIHSRPPKSIICLQCGSVFDTKQAFSSHKRFRCGRNAGSSSKSGATARDSESTTI